MVHHRLQDINKIIVPEKVKHWFLWFHGEVKTKEKVYSSPIKVKLQNESEGMRHAQGTFDMSLVYSCPVTAGIGSNTPHDSQSEWLFKKLGLVLGLALVFG